MKYFNPLKTLSRFEWFLWAFSALAVTLASVLSPDFSVLALIDSLIGVSSLMFVAKGDPLGQVLTVFFAAVYSVMAFQCRYYGELVINFCMMIPLALFSLYSWILHPYSNVSSQIKMEDIGLKQLLLLAVCLCVLITGGYFLLKFFNTANLIISVISLATSFTASYLMFFRSPFYAIAYMCNDVVLIIMWTLASLKNPGYITMIVNFSIFLCNDLYGFINWSRIKKAQKKQLKKE